jgi:DNA-binding transcriptional LysR family regulator
VTQASPDPLSGRDLAAFVAAFESGSLQAAADALCLTQSAASKRVLALEARLGTQLLTRGRRGVVATSSGKALYPDAKQALAALAQAADAVDGARGAEPLLLAASHTVGEFLLPGWLATYRTAERPPAARVEVEIVNTTEVLCRVRQRGDTIGFVEGLDVLDDLESVVMARDELVLAVAPDHRWAGRNTVPMEELLTESCFTRERDSGTRAVVTAALSQHGIELDVVLEATSIQALKRAVLSGGFTVLSGLAVEHEVQTGALCSLRIEGLALERELRAIRSRDERRPVPAERLWAWLVAGALSGHP